MNIGNTRNAFTLVELMIVIVIIAILAGLTTIGTRVAIQKTKAATVSLTMEQLSMAIEKYKSDIGEYPPDFTDLDAVARHIRKRWPRCEYPDVDEFLSYARARFYVDSNPPFGPASALIFWLGGFPDSNGKPAGFFLSPTNPLGVDDEKYELKSSQREEPRFDFPDGTIHNMEFTYRRFQYNPDSREYEIVPVSCHGPVFQPGKDDNKPVVYFCAAAPAQNSLGEGLELEEGAYQLSAMAVKYCAFNEKEPRLGYAVPYAKSPYGESWYEPERFQLIHPGHDGQFNDPDEEKFSVDDHKKGLGQRRFRVDPTPAEDILYPYPSTAFGTVADPDNTLNEIDDDNIVNFAEGGTLESLYPEQ